VKILQIRALRSGKDIATFDVAITEHLRLFNLTLRRNEQGALRSHSPKACGKHVASFHPELSEKITAAAVAALGGRSHVGQ
jgi:hypothetical protein